MRNNIFLCNFVQSQPAFKVTPVYGTEMFMKLKCRRARRKLVIFHSMVYSYCPRHLQLLLPQTVESYSHYPLRNAANIILPHCRTSQYYMYNSFIPTMVRTWNDLSMEMKETEDKRAFVSFLRASIPCENYLYSFGSRHESIRHTQMPLNCHLFRHGLTDHESCACGYEVEDLR